MLLSNIEAETHRGAVVPLAKNIPSVQPGGGICYRVELAWGRLRRWYLRTWRKEYVRRMEALRRGNLSGAPHPVLDPRDLKYITNRTTAHWLPSNDPFSWRNRIPLARWGLCEVQLFGWPLVIVLVVLWILGGPYRWGMILPGLFLVLVVSFFRNPHRQIPQGQGILVAPADGKIVEITPIDDPFLGGPAVRIGIFLSIFNVHINRAPTRARVLELRYTPGEFLNAMSPESGLRNESMWIGMEEESPPFRRMIVRQISGMIARRIVCTLRPGQVVDRGENFGMIKLGSRTELILPREEGLKIEIGLGEPVRAGETVLARFSGETVVVPEPRRA
ncbi:MAG: phosphatidylserine decarboxylase family protein [Pirellulales bacterium]|nr:phosphatidylserine decarboxylase family protein [Pirellulales bacterium]